MSNTSEPWQPILDTLIELRDAWPHKEWTWDHRIKGLSSTLPPDTVSKGEPPLLKAVPQVWTTETLAQAPAHVAGLTERCGALRPGQRMFTRDPVEGMVLFGLWWPWGDGVTVGVRLGVANCDRPKELYPAIRALFNIA